MADDGCNGGMVDETRTFGGGHYGRRGHKKAYGRGCHGRDGFENAVHLDPMYVEREDIGANTIPGRTTKPFQRRTFGANHAMSMTAPNADNRAVHVTGNIVRCIRVPAEATFRDLKHYLGGELSPMFWAKDTAVFVRDDNRMHLVDLDTPVHNMKGLFKNPHGEGVFAQVHFKFPDGTTAEHFMPNEHGAADISSIPHEMDMHPNPEYVRHIFEHGSDKMNVHFGYDHHMQHYFDGRNDDIKEQTRLAGKALFDKTSFKRYEPTEDGETPEFHFWIADRHTGALIEPLDHRIQAGQSMINALDQITGGVDGSEAHHVMLKAVAHFANPAPAETRGSV